MSRITGTEQPGERARMHNGSDEWYTQAEDVKLIVPYLVRKGYHRILCPFDREDSNFVKVLSANGFDVTHSHIEEGKDFFDIDISGYDAVVSNPPFSRWDGIIQRLFESGIPFAMIANLNRVFDSRKRYDLFERYGVELIVPRGRMRFISGDRKSNLKHKCPPFQSAYVCRGMIDKQVELSGSNP